MTSPHAQPSAGRASIAGFSSVMNNTSMVTGGDAFSHNIITTNNYLSAEIPAVRISDIILMLRVVDYKINHDKVYSRRAPHTGKWFLESPKYGEWINGDNEKFQNLECQGIPSAGKTTLVSAVIEDLLARFPPSSTSHIVLYSYFRYDTQSSQNARTVIANLLSQAIQRVDEASQAVLSLYKEYSHHVGTLPRLDKTMAALKSELTGYEKVYIVVDALDEYCVENYDNCRELVDCLQQLGAQLLITSRIKVPFKDRTFSQIPIRAQSEDVGAFIHQNIKGRLAELCDRSPGLREEIYDKLSEKAQGMFVIPRLHMEWISRRKSPREVREALQELPTGLHDTYLTTMERILNQGSDEAQLAIRAIMWVFYAKEPLPIAALQAAVSFTVGMLTIDDDCLVGEDDIFSACAGLIILQRGRVQFVHFSTQEFFAKYSAKYFQDAEFYITETCLHYLVVVASIVPEEITSTIVRSEDINPGFPYLRRFPLCHYAAFRWGRHASGLGERIDPQLVSNVCSQPIAPYMCEYLQLDLHGYDEIVPTLAMPPLHYKILYLALCGLTTLFQSHFPLQLSAVVNDHNGQHPDLPLHGIKDTLERSPLHFAASAGHLEIASILLEAGADVDALDHDHKTALHAAVSGGRSDIVSLLITRGANLDIQSLYGGETPLHFSAAQGRKAEAQLLIDGGANPTVLSLTQRTARDWALANGHSEIAEILQLAEEHHAAWLARAQTKLQDCQHPKTHAEMHNSQQQPERDLLTSLPARSSKNGFRKVIGQWRDKMKSNRKRT